MAPNYDHSEDVNGTNLLTSDDAFDVGPILLDTPSVSVNNDEEEESSSTYILAAVLLVFALLVLIGLGMLVARRLRRREMDPSGVTPSGPGSVTRPDPNSPQTTK